LSDCKLRDGVVLHGISFFFFPIGALQTIQQMNPLAPDPEHRSAIEKGWKEGQDYFRVETAIVCHDGESIQV